MSRAVLQIGSNIWTPLLMGLGRTFGPHLKHCKHYHDVDCEILSKTTAVLIILWDKKIKANSSLNNVKMQEHQHPLTGISAAGKTATFLL